MRARPALLAAVFLPAVALAQTVPPASPVPLSGDLGFTPDLCPEGPGSARCILQIFIDGPAARVIYDSMPVEARPEQCTGGTEKIDANGMYCNMAADGSVFCELGYLAAEQRFVYGGIGC